MFRKLPVLLLLMISVILIINPYLSLEIKQTIYAISLTIKSLILSLLPFIIFGLLFNALVGMSRGATSIIILILVAVCTSSYIATFLSHFVGSWIYGFQFSLIMPKATAGLTPSWVFEFPRLFPNNYAMFLGIILGLIMGRWLPKLAYQLSTIFEKWIAKILKVFGVLMLFFVAGFIVKMQYDGVVKTIIKDYTLIFLVILCAQITYIAFTYALMSGFRPKEFFATVKNMLPAAMAGFTTMSSASVMPLTIIGAERNAQNKEIARSVIPVTVNVHLIGDCVAIPIFAYALMKSFGLPEPSLLAYLVFVVYFVMAKFSVAAVPGGGIMVMLPVLESCLGFTSEMLSLMAAIYILFDPVVTSANVLGNGMFAKAIDKMVSFQFFKKPAALPLAEKT